MQPSEIISLIQLILNGGVLIIAGFAINQYRMGVKQTIEAKDAQVALWKDKSDELAKHSPEALERSLATRIGNANDEIQRLNADREGDKKRIDELAEEAKAMNKTLEHARGFRRMLELEGDMLDDDALYKGAEIDVVRLGHVAVDSGQLMITDPCYIDSLWEKEPFEDVRRFYDSATGEVVEFRKDFDHFEQTLPGRTETVNALIATGELTKLEEPLDKKARYSYAGACAASLNEGYGELPFPLGHEGAGLAFRTAFGDGVYPVYGERRDDRIVRVYINVG